MHFSLFPDYHHLDRLNPEIVSPPYHPYSKSISNHEIRRPINLLSIPDVTLPRIPQSKMKTGAPTSRASPRLILIAIYITLRRQKPQSRSRSPQFPHNQARTRHARDRQHRKPTNFRLTVYEPCIFPGKPGFERTSPCHFSRFAHLP